LNYFWNDKVQYGTLGTTVPFYNISTHCHRK